MEVQRFSTGRKTRTRCQLAMANPDGIRLSASRVWPSRDIEVVALLYD
jgi:hypothetical protein